MTSNPRIDDLRSRLEREPGSRLFAQLAEELRKAGELDEAIRVARAGLSRHSTYTSARLTLARALSDLGDLRAARAELEAVAAEAPDNILACRLLAETLEGLGLRDQAAARYRAVLQLAPGDKHALGQLEALALAATTPAAPGPPESPPPGDLPSPPPLDETPIPLAQVDDEEFELERPTDTTVRLVSGTEAQPGAAAGLAVVGAPDEVGGASVAPEPAAGETDDFGSGREELVFDFTGDDNDSAPTLPFARTPLSAEPAPAGQGGDRAAPAAVAAAPGDAGPDGAPPSERRPLSTPTLAELYYAQGVPEKAAEVYSQIVEREPWNERARGRLREIETRLGEAAARASAEVAGEQSPRRPPADRREALERTIARLEAFLRLVREGRTKWPASPIR